MSDVNDIRDQFGERLWKTPDELKGDPVEKDMSNKCVRCGQFDVSAFPCSNPNGHRWSSDEALDREIAELEKNERDKYPNPMTDKERRDIDQLLQGEKPMPSEQEIDETYVDPNYDTWLAALAFLEQDGYQPDLGIETVAGMVTRFHVERLESDRRNVAALRDEVRRVQLEEKAKTTSLGSDVKWANPWDEREAK